MQVAVYELKWVPVQFECGKEENYLALFMHCYIINIIWEISRLFLKIQVAFSELK